MFFPDLKRLCSKLSLPTRATLEAALDIAVERGHADLLAEHWVIALLRQPGGDATMILQSHGIRHDMLAMVLEQALQRLPCGCRRSPALGPDVLEMMRGAWLFASVDRDDQAIRGGHLLVAAIAGDLLGHVRAARTLLAPLRAETLRQFFDDITMGSSEHPGTRPAKTQAEAGNVHWLRR